MPEVSADQGKVRARWVAPAVYSLLGAELAVVIAFAATYNALDFRIYMWGGHAVTHDTRLYLALAFGHWFTYSPFAAVVFVPIAALPLAVASPIAANAIGITAHQLPMCAAPSAILIAAA